MPAQTENTADFSATAQVKPIVGVNLTAPAEKGEDLISLDDILDLSIDSEASDIHFSEKTKIALRIHGVIRFVDSAPPLTKKQAEHLIFSLMRYDQNAVNSFLQTLEGDFAYEHRDGTPFRCNVFFRRGCMSAVLRRIERKSKTIAELGLPVSVKKFTEAEQGLVLITGPTGSGKSTSMCAMLDEINQNRIDHIITIEDPIEFIFQPKKSIISQREVGHDTRSFGNALRAAMREDPDVVMIGEMRDTETISAAVNLAETGHLVFSTFHTSGASQTISRLISYFSAEQQTQIQARLADSLLGVLSQRLVPRIGGGRAGVYELVVMNAALRNIVRTGELAQMDNAIHTGTESGMISMRRFATDLVQKGVISEEDVAGFFKEE